MRRGWRLALYILGGTAAMICLLLAAAAFVSQTDWFKNQVRERIVAVVEDSTGGRVEIGRFNYDWPARTATATSFVLHGTEAAGSPPLLKASRIAVGLKIISPWKRQVDIASLHLEKPEIHVEVRPDGSTNLPTPRVAFRPGEDLISDILDLRIGKLSVHDGSLDYNSRRTPLEIDAGGVTAAFRYERHPRRYTGEISSGTVSVNLPGGGHGALFSLDSKLAITPGKLEILSSRIATRSSHMEFTGQVNKPTSPAGFFQVQGEVAPAEIAKIFGAPVDARGEVSVAGHGSFETSPFRYTFAGTAAGKGLSYRSKDARIQGANFRTELRATPESVALDRLSLNALGGQFRGRLSITGGNKLRVDGEGSNLSIRQAATLAGQPPADLDGTVTGPVHAEAQIRNGKLTDLNASGTVDIAPGSAGTPLSGKLDFAYEGKTGAVTLRDSNASVGATQLNVSGTLGQTLQLHVVSRDLRDLIRAFPLAGLEPPRELPVHLRGGLARFDGTVTGSLRDPQVRGQLDLTRFEYEGKRFDHLTASFDLGRSLADVKNFALDQDTLHAAGSGEIALKDWRPTDASALTVAVAFRGGDLKRLIAESGSSVQAPLTGTVSGTAMLRGTLGAPEGTARLALANATAYRESFSNVNAELGFHDGTVQLLRGRATQGKAALDATGSYAHAASDWSSGELRLAVRTNGVTLAQVKSAEPYRGQVNGTAEANANIAGRFVKGDFRLESLTGNLALRHLTAEGREYGDVELKAQTQGAVLHVSGDGNLRGAHLQGAGEWKLAGDYPGHAEITIPRLTFATIHELVPHPARQELPFEGFLDGVARIDIPLKKPEALRATVRLDQVQINANPSARPGAGAQARDLVLRNSAPVELTATSKRIDIQSARFAGTDTTLEGSGSLAIGTKNPWNIAVNGNINLAVLQIFNPDLLASGASAVNLAMRGPFTEPEISGRLELRNASLYVRDLPNGLDQANGVFLFDQNRATVQRLTAVSGGGTVSIQPGSFVGFRGPTLLYRVQGQAENVRFRSPEGVSITANAALNLLGTSQSSVLSGTVTVVRAGFNPQTDVGGILASTAKPVATPVTPNAYFEGMHLDVRVESAANLEIQTSLTRNLDAEANLRIRGTPERPVVLGNISVNEGEVDFFGSKYQITQGEVNFFNTARIEPIIDLDLETVVRGITVEISLTGPINKLNFSYRSDPPLESNQIIALLAVGRTPATAGSLASSQVSTNTNYLATGSNALLGQALAAPVSGRLQRFFGVSHLKIDPQFTDLSSVPEARLTLEQQISKDITLTYITNLSRTDQQIVRVEWDFSPHWSAVALRDENGAFGVDIFYRKRFK